MTRRGTMSWLVVILPVLWAPVAPAGDGATKREEVVWQASAQGGLAITTGSAQVTALSASTTISRSSHQHRLRVEAGGTYARSRLLLARDRDASGTIDGWDEIHERSVPANESWRLHTRYDFFPTRRNVLYAAALASGDKPAGKDFVGGVQAGYSRVVVDGRAHDFVAELGYDFRHEDLVSGPGVAIQSLRSQLGYTGKLGLVTTVEASVEGLLNVNVLDMPAARIAPLQDARIDAKLSITTELHENVSFRFGFEVELDSMPAPLPALDIPFGDGFRPRASVVDTRTEATIIVDLI